jgi:excisionase family DNA binding protein
MNQIELTTKEAAARLGVCPRWLRRLARNGRIGSIDRAGRRFFLPSVVDAFGAVPRVRGRHLKGGVA